MKFRTYKRVGNLSFCLGWYKGEPFKLFHLELLNLDYENYATTILDFQVFKFCLSITMYE